MLTGKQKKALAALLQNPKIGEACKIAGCTEKTLRNYLRNPEFKAEYTRLTDEVLNEATTKATCSMYSALETLAEIAEDRNRTDASRTAAARALVDAGVRLHTVNDLAVRVAELERIKEDNNP